MLEQAKKTGLKIDLQFEAITKEFGNQLEDLIKITKDLQDQIKSSKENLKLVATEALQLQDDQGHINEQ